MYLGNSLLTIHVDRTFDDVHSVHSCRFFQGGTEWLYPANGQPCIPGMGDGGNRKREDETAALEGRDWSFGVGGRDSRSGNRWQDGEQYGSGMYCFLLDTVPYCVATQVH